MSSSTPANEFVADTMGLVLRLAQVAEYLKRFPNFRAYPMSLAVAQSAAQVTDIPELDDRLMAGTTRLLGFDLITNYPIMRASFFVKTIW